MGAIPLPKSPVTRSDAFRDGKKFFYTATPCRRGHLAVRYVSTGACTACLNAFKGEGARNAYDANLVPFDGSGLWRPRHWDAETLARAKKAVQGFLNGWSDALTPPAPEPDNLKFRKVFGERMISTRSLTDDGGYVHDVYTTRTGHPRRQLSVPRSGSPSDMGGGYVELFTEEALSCPDWVCVEGQWFACENIDYACYPVLRAEVVSIAALHFGADGSV